MPNIYLIAIDGLIGAGKTTLINKIISNSSLKKQIDFKIIKEPLDIFKFLF